MKYINKLKENWQVCSLIIIAFISHWYIFFDHNILTTGDWAFYFNSQAHTLSNFNIYLSSFNLGTVMPTPSNWIFLSLFSLLTKIHISWNIFERIFFLIPIVFFTPLTSFFLFKNITNNQLIAFFASCIYSFNTFFLRLQMDWLTYAFVWWILPLLFLCLLKYLDNNDRRYLLLISFLTFIGIVSEIRIVILVLSFLSIYLIFYLLLISKNFLSKLRNILYILLSIIVGMLMHAFWLLPFKFTHLGGDILANAASNPFISFFSLLDCLTLRSYQWSHNFALEGFYKQPIDARHFLIPIVAIIGIISYRYFFKKESQTIFAMFMSTMLLIFVFLGKQEHYPLPTLYGWFFDHIPLFNLYRESSKFLILIALPMSFFFGIGLFYIWETGKKINRPIFLITVSLILFFSSIFNLQHFIDQKIGGMIRGVSIPADYKIIENRLSTDKEYYRVLWVPSKPKFGFYSDNHPFINETDLTVLFEDKIHLSLFDIHSTIQDQVTYLLKQKYGVNLLNESSAKYFIIPINEPREKRIDINKRETVYELYEYFGPREYYVNELNHLSYLKKVDWGTKDLIVYENLNFKPHLYTTDKVETINSSSTYKTIDYSSINPTKYVIDLRGVGKSFYLNFSEKYNLEWKMIIGPLKWWEVVTGKTLFLSNKYHFENDAKLNSFYIDPVSICKTYACKKNTDGSYDMSLTLYFRPQSYMYLGLIISGTTLILCVGYLGFYFVRRRIKNANKI